VNPVLEVTTLELRALQAKGGRILVDVWAEWCGPCKTMVPRLEEVASTLGSDVTVVKINAETERDFVKNNNVQTLPTLIVFHEFRELRRVVGSKSVKDVIKLVTGE